MTRIERHALENPALYAFGTVPRFLTATEEAHASREDRIRGIWPFLVKRVQRFLQGITARERITLSVEDIVHTVAVTLIERDHRWDPKRGRYMTFANTIISNVFITERERARVVAAPANAHRQLRLYQQLQAEGRLTAAQRRTKGALERVLGETERVEETRLCAPAEPDRAPPSQELIDAIKDLDCPLQALVLARTAGLWGDESTLVELAQDLQQSRRAVQNLQSQAKEALRGRITRLQRERAGRLPDVDPGL